MSGVPECKRIGDLLKLFGGLRALYEQLLGLIQSKVDALRRADMSTMRRLAEEEHSVVARLHEREGFCRQLLDALGEELGCSPRAGRLLCVSEIVSRLPVAERAPLRRAADGLGEVILKATRANRMAGVVSREVLNHMKWILGAVRPGGAIPVGYSGDGTLIAPSQTRILEAVG